MIITVLIVIRLNLHNLTRKIREKIYNRVIYLNRNQ